MISSGCCGLERLQFVHQAIKVGIADLGIVEHVVAVLVVADFFAQRVDLALHIFRRRHGLIMPVDVSYRWLVRTTACQVRPPA